LVRANFGSSPKMVFEGQANAFLQCGDCTELLKQVPARSVDLVITDPPHSDRIPYLELSELWNSILGASCDFDSEIVISNAKERAKTSANYLKALRAVMQELARIISPQGFVVILFNSRSSGHWGAFRSMLSPSSSSEVPLRYLGRFPCIYSATSVVQDHRAGALPTDYAIVLASSASLANADVRLAHLSRLPYWSPDPPPFLMGGTGS
jgi:hypothetical protein